MDRVVSDNPQLFNELKKKPTIAWPTVLLLIMILGVTAFSWVSVLFFELPLWVGCLMNCMVYPYIFSPGHDGLHGAISSNRQLNEFLTACALVPLFLFLPVIPHARYGHMQHHRHTGNPSEDPDFFITSRFERVLTWFFWGYHYVPYFLKQNPEVHAKITANIKFLRLRQFVSLSLFALLIWNFPLEMLFLWAVPFMIAAMTIALLAGYLVHSVHEKHEGEDASSEYQVTCNITGWERILTPIMQYQNYHLVHHLYPTVPFYRYIAVWNARKQFHDSHNPASINLA